VAQGHADLFEISVGKVRPDFNVDFVFAECDAASGIHCLKRKRDCLSPPGFT
jgi:hypothetical protein